MTQEHLDLHLYLNKEENTQPKKKKHNDLDTSLLPSILSIAVYSKILTIDLLFFKDAYRKDENYILLVSLEKIYQSAWKE
jgi:hypothetical protein